MADGYEALTEKEKVTLRLMVRGHDAKSMAAELSLSVHTINERLRAARRKLGVTSSREAARLVFEREAGRPEKPVAKKLGEAAEAGASEEGAATAGNPARRWIAGALLMLTVLAAGLIFTSHYAGTGAAGPATEFQTADEATESAARAWLELVDASDWQASYDATGTAFRDLNTIEGWASASQQVRTPLGALVSRELTGEHYVNAPPHGYREVTFTSRFANQPSATERVTLVREGDEWKVVGFLIE